MYSSQFYRSLIRLLFLFYIGFLLILFFLPMESSAKGFNFFPLQTIYQMYHYPSKLFAFVNVIGNITLLIPLGLFLPIVHSYFDRFFKVFLTGLIMVCLIEMIQYIFLSGLRTADIDDIILNITGISTGYLIVHQLKIHSKQDEE